MTKADSYSAIFKALLTEEALDAAGRGKSSTLGMEYDQISVLLGTDSLDEVHVGRAVNMSAVYVIVAAFENSVRELVVRTLLEEVGEDWWAKTVPKGIRDGAQKRKNDEEKVRWHTQRGGELVEFTMLPNLLAIMRNNFEFFEPAITNIDWAGSIFDIVERSRNVIMHSGELEMRDISRLGSAIRDWSSQVSV